MNREAYIEDTMDAARDHLHWLTCADKPSEALDGAIDEVVDAVWEEDDARIDAALDRMVEAYNDSLVHLPEADRPRKPMPGRDAITA